MRLKYKCIKCDRMFYKEYNLISHILFEHEFLMPICSTGIDEKIFKDNVKLINDFKQSRKLFQSAKSELKRKFLKDRYGLRELKRMEKDSGMSWMKMSLLDNLFKQNLENYHNGIFTRIIYLEHSKYDIMFEKSSKLLSQINAKGLILG